MRPEDERSTSEPAHPVAQAGAAVASLAEAWLRDTALCAVGLLSLGVALAGLDPGGAWSALGIGVAIAGAGTAITAVVRHWRPSRIWLTMLTVALVEVVVILVMIRG